MQEVTLMQMLEAREAWLLEQQRLLEEFRRPVICFTMNIPGPVKDSPLIRRAFDWGRSTLNCRLPGKRVLYSAVRRAVTGCEALYAVDMDPLELKRLCSGVEDETELGRLWRPEGRWEREQLFREVAAMTGRAMAEDLSRGGDTVGQRLYALRGISGIRGEAARGLPSVAEVGLPVYDECRKRGLDQNRAGAVTLLHLIAHVEDTNMVAGGGEEDAAEGANRAAWLVRDGREPSVEEMEKLDDWFIRDNLSPGGCAGHGGGGLLCIKADGRTKVRAEKDCISGKFQLSPV